MNHFCVIGSGPSAVAAALALTGRGIAVTMLDAGHSLDDARARLVERLSASDPQQWNEADVRQLRNGVEVSARGIPLKRLYGSDFPFATDGVNLELEYRNAGVRPSFARGGLSNVWGAGILPFHRDDLTGWPFDASELNDGYRGVQSFMPCSGDLAEGGFDELFPSYADKLHALPPSLQGQAFLADTSRARTQLALAGIFSGTARLAVDGGACRRCGMCLYGCPYGLIYNSRTTLRQLLDSPGFRYESGFVVERLQEQGGVVQIEGHDLVSQERRNMTADRVLLGAGAIPSTAIVLSSLGEFDVPVRILDSFYFLLPLLRFSGVRGLAEEQLHTLAQAFLVFRDPEVSRQFVHFSIYGYNDLMRPSMEAAAGPFGVPEAMVSRTLIAGGYLHSDLSPGLRITVPRRGPIVLEGEEAAGAPGIARKAASKLLKHARQLRALAIVPALRFSTPGRGFHCGGSFPMRIQRVRHTSDVEGRPFGFERVHLIDASCLPSIPATPITLPVMANAWRIADRAADRA